MADNTGTVLFDARLRNPDEVLVADLEPDSDTLLVVFSGIAGGLGVPAHQFMGATEPLGVKRLFLRDPHCLWYLRGVPGLGDDAPGIARGLRQIAERSGATRITCVGNSAGGWGALLVGSLAGADRVLVFSPRTSARVAFRLRHRDGRYWRDAVRLAARGGGGRHRDLLLLPRLAPTELHYPAHSRLDRAHAERLAGCDGVTLHAHDSANHQVVRELRASGELGRLLQRLVTSQAPR
jgi:hypothetical protein